MADSFRPLGVTATLPLQVSQQIGAAIVAGQFRPGERLREVELASIFGVSRATIREALLMLEGSAVVTLTPQRGAHVAILSEDEVNDLFEIRAALLGLASRQAAERFKKSSSSLLAERLSNLEAEIDDHDAYFKASGAMVDAITSISANEALRRLLSSFSLRIGRYVRDGLLSRARRERSLVNWKGLVQAIELGHADLAQVIHRTLALENRDAALAKLSSSPPAPSRLVAQVERPTRGP